MDEKSKRYERNRKNSKALNFRVSTKLYKELTMIAEQKGVSRSDVVRDRLEGLVYQPPLIDEKNVQELKNQLLQIGNNINQIAHGINKIKRSYEQESEKHKENNSIFREKSYNFFQERVANEIANIFQESNPERIFTVENKKSFRYARLSDQQKNYFEKIMISGKYPMTREEYLVIIENRLVEVLTDIKKEWRELWELL